MSTKTYRKSRKRSVSVEDIKAVGIEAILATYFSEMKKRFTWNESHITALKKSNLTTQDRKNLEGLEFNNLDARNFNLGKGSGKTGRKYNP